MTVELREVGRVLSAKNAATLRQARETITALLSLVDIPEPGDDEEDAPEDGEEAVHEAFAFLGEMVGVDLNECGADCKLCSGGAAMKEADAPTPESVDYRAAGLNDGRCGNCAHMQEGRCTLLEMKVNAEWTCDEFEEDDSLGESVNLGGLVDLEEGAIRADGTTTIKVISPGWGSSGYYSEDVLKRDGPKAWPKGTHMYWDHPTPTEESERPERSLKDLAAVTTTDPRWWVHPTEGPGLYAEAKVRSSYREAVNELAPNIGTSIRASGKATEGTAEGKKGRIVEAIVAGKSIDFVTMPGRGGKVLELFESFRSKEVTDDVSTAELVEARRKLAESEAENQSLREAVLGSAAATFASEYLGKAGLPPAAQARLLETIYVEDLPTTKDGKLDESAFKATLDEAIKAETAYIEKLTGKKPAVTGFGPSAGATNGLEESGNPADLEAAHKELASAMVSLGLSESSAAVAARGRN